MKEKTPKILKPQTNRFRDSMKFTESENTNQTTTELKKPKTTAKKGAKAGEVRTNFDCPIHLKDDLEEFVSKSKRSDYKGSVRFASNKEFLIQCVKDGLKKYSK